MQDFGWTSARAGGVLIVDRVDPGGPAGGRLQQGDAIVAWNGDPRITRIGPVWYRRMPAGASYALTIRRDGREQVVTLTPLERHDVDQGRLRWVLYLVCGVLFLARSLPDTITVIVAPGQIFDNDQHSRRVGPSG